MFVWPVAAAKTLLPPEPARLTLVEGTRLLYASRAVRVRVMAALPLATTELGLAVNVLLADVGLPAVNAMGALKEALNAAAIKKCHKLIC